MAVQVLPMGVHAFHLTRVTYLCVSCLEVQGRMAVAFGSAFKCLMDLNLSGNEDLYHACAPALVQMTGCDIIGISALPGFAEGWLLQELHLQGLQ